MHLGRFRAADETSEAENEAKHMAHEEGKREPYRCDHASRFRESVLRGESMTEPVRPLEALIKKWRVEASQTLSAASMWPQDSHQFDALMALCDMAKRHAD